MRNSATCIIPLTTGQLVYKANEPYINDAIITVMREIRTDREMEEFERRIKGRSPPSTTSTPRTTAPSGSTTPWSALATR